MRDGADDAGVEEPPDRVGEPASDVNRPDGESDGGPPGEVVHAPTGERDREPVPIEPESPELEDVLFVLLGVIGTVVLLLGGI